MFARLPSSQQQRLARWFTLSGYDEPIVRYRALSNYVIAALVICLTVPIYIFMVGTSLFQNPLDIGTLISVLISATVIDGLLFGVIALTRAKQQVLGSGLIVVMLAVSIILGLTTNPVLDTFSILVTASLWMLLSIAGLLLGLAGLSISFVVAMIIALFSASTSASAISEGPVLFFLFIALGLLTQFAVIWLSTRGQSETAQRINLLFARRSNFDQTAQAIAGQSISGQELDALLIQTVRLVRNTLPEIDLAQLWLVDDDQRTVSLAVSSDRNDKPGRKVGIGSLDIVGRAAIEGHSILVRDTPAELTYRRTALMPGIASLLAAPFKLQGTTNGVLVIASTQADAFTEPEVNAMQTVADQVALAIENARLHAASQTSAAEIRRLSEQVDSNRQTIARLSQEATAHAWRAYLQGRARTPAFTIDLTGGKIAVENSAEWTETLAEAQRSGQVVQTQQHSPDSGTSSQDYPIIALPILVNDRAVGAVEFELEPGQTISDAQLQAIQRVIERMALSAENARLFEEAHELAQREILVGEIGARLQSAPSVDSVLSIAAQSLAESLKASRVAIRLSTTFSDDRDRALAQAQGS